MADIKKAAAAAKPVAKAVAATKPAEAKVEEKKAAPAKTTENVFVEYNGGQIAVSELVAKAAELSGKKSIKTLNVYYQPETNKVYYTADGDNGSFDL